MATQDETVGQATPGIPMSKVGMAGVGWIRQPCPFHRSARVNGPAPVKFSPNAVQVVDVGQATLVRKMFWPGGLGVGWMRHRVPFHRSARVLPLLAFPTAVHAEADAQETLLRKAPPAGLGVVWIRHRVPFHRSARVVPSALPPTAVQAESDVQDTPFRAPPPAGLGIGRSCQARPFHHSARAAEARDLLVVAPTVTQADGEAHHALFRKLDAAPGGLGAAWMRQVGPGERSTSTAVDPFRSEYPTAVHAAADEHATPISRLAAPPPRLGVAWMRHRVPFHRSARVWKVPERLI